ncbi:MAG: bacteriohemerythrin [Bacteroidetes bacterium]|nr:bacteriohemerythrin [Bacteroidota bacterium]
MSTITWRDTYSVGIQKIDDQHKELISIINEIYDAHHQGTSQTVIIDTLEKLVDYTIYHFSMEEDLFVQCNYPKKDDHMSEHKEFVGKIADLKQEGRKGNLLLSLKTIDFLKDWTINHILGTDMEFGAFLKEKEIG